MAAQQGQQIAFEFGPFLEYVKETEGFERLLESVGTEQFLAGLSPEKREELRRRLNQQEEPHNKSDPT